MQDGDPIDPGMTDRGGSSLCENSEGRKSSPILKDSDRAESQISRKNRALYSEMEASDTFSHSFDQIGASRRG